MQRAAELEAANDNSLVDPLANVAEPQSRGPSYHPAGTPPRRSACRRRAKFVISATQLLPLTSPLLSTTFLSDARRKRVERCCRDELHG